MTLLFLALTQFALAGTICSDGTVSNSSGSGTCSHHGGIAGIVPATSFVSFDELKVHARSAVPGLQAFFEQGSAASLPKYTYDELVKRLLVVEDPEYINTIPFVDVELAIAVTGKRKLKIGIYELAVMNKDSNKMSFYRLLVVRRGYDTLLIRDPSTVAWGLGAGFNGGFGGTGPQGKGTGAGVEPYVTEAWQVEETASGILSGLVDQEIMMREFLRMKSTLKQPTYCPEKVATECPGNALPGVTIYPISDLVLKDATEDVFLVTNYASERTQLSDVFVGYMKLIKEVPDWGSKSLLGENWKLVDPSAVPQKDNCPWGTGRCADRREPGEWDNFSM